MHRRVPIQHALQRRTGLQHRRQFTDVYLEAFSANLHHRTMRASPEPSCHRYGREALVSYHSHFNAFSFLRREDQRNHASVQEVSIVQLLVSLLQAQTLWQRDELQMGPNGVKFFLRKRKKDGVGHWFSRRVCPFPGI